MWRHSSDTSNESKLSVVRWLHWNFGWSEPQLTEK